MKSRKYKTGVTLMEMLIVIAVIAILATSVITVTRYVASKSEIKLAEGNIALITAALEQFADYGYHYTDTNSVAYSQFTFPLDCNSLAEADVNDMLNNTLKDALNADSVAINGGSHLPEYSGSEILYFFLTQIPTSRETINQLDSSLITNKDKNGNEMFITITRGGKDRTYPLYRIIDTWSKALHYDYYENELSPDPKTAKTFPVITSAGPDGEFGTADDITSR